MPKTFWQSVVFTTIMAIMMILIMSHYNMFLHAHFELFQWQNFLAELFFAMPVALLLAGKVAPKLAHKLLNSDTSPITMGITITFFIVAIMVPIMSLFILVRKVGINNLTWSLYGKAVLFNFMMAFPVQVLFLGHFVRKLFRHVIGIKYKCRRSLAPVNPYLKNANTIRATKMALIASAIAVCVFSI